MYTAHFGLSAAPFSITPDPQYLYLSAPHKEALAHLLYGVNEGPGFVLLTGEVGTGKTTLCRCLIEQLSENVDVALILNPRLTPIELLSALFDELRIAYTAQFSLKNFIDTLYSYLLTAYAVKRRTVLIVDEAQNLSTEVLEQVRLLTNLETTSQKLLQIILVGQPELQVLLEQNDLRQLAQRITARYHLPPLPPKETEAYIEHRLKISGAQRPLFSKPAVKWIHRYSRGIPRLINIICDRALLGGYVNNKSPIDSKIIHKAVREVRGERPNSRKGVINVGLFILLLGLGGYGWYSLSSSLNHPPPASNPTELPVTSLPVPPAPIKPSLLSLLQSPTGSIPAEVAINTLFKQWELDYGSLSGSTPCERAATRELACLYKVGTWIELQTLNRPAILELVTDAGTGRKQAITLTALEADQATLQLGEESFNLKLSELTPFWLGQFSLLWKPPTLPVSLISLGAQGPAVLWVRQQLWKAELNKSPPSNFSMVFDRNLRQRVIAFQQQHNLVADGVIGEQSLLLLQAFSEEGPVLKSRAEVEKVVPAVP